MYQCYVFLFYCKRFCCQSKFSDCEIENRPTLPAAQPNLADLYLLRAEQDDSPTLGLAQSVAT